MMTVRPWGHRAVPDFELDPRLDADSLFLADWPLCRVLRFNDQAYPWLILVPRRAGVREIIDLDPAEWHRIPDHGPRRKRKGDH